MKPQVLLVDDNLIQSAARSAILTRSGLKVEVTQDAHEALELLGRQDTRNSLRLLVTDHLMPLMNGPELVRLARQLLPDLPVLVLSGLVDAEAEYADLQVCFRLKPLPPEELIRVAHGLVDDAVLRSA